MLTPPMEWRTFTTAYVVEHLLRQAAATKLYAEAARAFTKAAIDFMIAGPRWDRSRDTLQLTSHPNGWQLDNWYIHVLPTTDDNALDQISELPKVTGGIDLLAPPWSKCLVEHAVRSAFPGHPFDVSGVDMFCTFRVLWTGIDLNQPHARSLHDLLTRYRNLTQSFPDITLSPTFNTPTD